MKKFTKSYHGECAVRRFSAIHDSGYMVKYFTNWLISIERSKHGYHPRKRTLIVGCRCHRFTDLGPLNLAK